MSDSDGSTDSFTEISHTSWLARIGQSIKGVLFGLLFIVVAGILLFWNEGRAVQTIRSLAEGSGLVTDVAPDRVDPANQGKLVHVSGDIKAQGRISDPEFGVSTDGLRLVRTVEMYQWKEKTSTTTHKNMGGSEETTTIYSYTHAWSDARIDSSMFHHRDGHANPEMRFRRVTVMAQDATLGGFRPGAAVLSQLPASQQVAVEPATADALRGRISGPVQATDGHLYLGANANQPSVGDLRISFQMAPQGPASIIGQQVGSGFSKYQTKAGDQLLLVESGTASAAAMFKSAAEQNRILTWVLRLVGVLVMWIGFFMILRPLVIVADVVPLIGSILGVGAGLAALVGTAVLASLIIAFAWLWYRPLISVIALAIGALLIYGVKTLVASRTSVRHAPAG
jgi:Transmembrane protein 43